METIPWNPTLRALLGAANYHWEQRNAALYEQAMERLFAAIDAEVAFRRAREVRA